MGIERLGLFALKRPYVALFLVLMLTLFLLPGIFLIEFNSETRDIFRSESRAFDTYEEMIRNYPSGETDFYFIVEGERIFTPKALEQLGALHMELLSVEGIRSVLSMFSARYPPSAGAGLASKSVFPFHLDEITDVEALKQVFLNHPHVAGKLLSSDATLTLFIIALDGAGIGIEQMKSIKTDINEVAEELLTDTGLSFTMTGGQMLRLEIIAALMRVNLTFIIVGVLLGLSITWFFLKQFRYVAIAAGPILATLVWLVGGMGYLGQQFNILTNAVPPLVIAISLAESLHLLILLRRYLEKGLVLKEALERAVREIGPACFLSYFTTAIALLSLTLVQYPFISNFGLTAALGVGLAYIATILLLPSLALLLLPADGIDSAGKDKSRQATSLVSIMSLAAADAVSARPRFIMSVGIIGVILFGALYAQAQPSYIYTENLPKESPSLHALVKINERLAGASTLRIFLQWSEGERQSTGHMLEVIREVHGELQQTPLVKAIWSLHTADHWINGEGSGGVDVIDYLQSLQPGLKEKLVSADRRTAMVGGYYAGLDAVEMLPILNGLEERLKSIEQRYPGVVISLSGLSPLSVKASYEMIGQLNRGLLLAVCLIIVLIVLLLYSIKAGLLSILPNLLPIVVGGGYLYISGAGLQFFSVIAFTIGFGIAVDSTIHILNRYRISQGEGLSPQQAVRETVIAMGPVLIVSTLVLAAGFGATLLSSLPMVELFGQVSLILLFTALIGDLLLLPAIIRVVDDRGKSEAG